MATLASVDLNLLVALRALLRHRSVTQAAAEVGVSQPAMSNMLRRLRHLLGDELLIRVGKTYELTARASALLEPLERALRTIDNEVVRAPVFTPGESRRTFTVASSNAAAATVLSGLVRKLGVEAPHAALQLLPLVPSSAQLLGDTLRIPDLVRLPHIVFDMDGVSVSAELTLRAVVPDRRVQATVSDFLSIPFLLRGTTMISVLQGRVARLLSAHGLVRVLGCPVQLPALGIDMVWNPRGTTDPAYAWLRRQLLDLV